jgi:hypothetical protein
MFKDTKQQRLAKHEAALESIEFPDFSLKIKKAFTEYSGDFAVFETAIGALFLGIMIGWRPLFIIHSPKTIKRYEKILDIEFQKILPETVDFLSERSRGYQIAAALDKFWPAVTGNIPIDGRKIATGLDVHLT